MTKWNMSTAANITYRGYPIWKLPSPDNFFPGFTYYNVPDLRMNFVISSGERFRVEFHNDAHSDRVDVKIFDKECGDNPVWEQVYGCPAYGALPWEEASKALTLHTIITALEN